MRARAAAIFSFGFAAGMAVLAIVLWSTGHLTANERGPAVATTTTRLNPVDVPAVRPPDPVPLPTREAAVEPPAGPRLGMPLAGLDPAKLTSTFHQARAGHEHEALDIMAPRGTP